MAAVELVAIRKSFGDVEVVHGVDLSIADGELLTLVGPSGCGKSTLLSIIAGLEAPSAGEIRIDGAVMNDRSPKERGVAMVFQSYALYPHMSVRRNIGFPLEVEGRPRKEIDARARETADRLGLSDLLDRKPRELSGGQRQRVALGRALVRRPRLCLFDEPLSNLDASLRAQTRVSIKKLHEETRATFVYVTHDQAEAMTLSDRMVVLDRGSIRQVGPPHEVYRRPVDTFVARFLGAPEINLVPPDAIGLDDDRAHVTIGIRPEDIRVTHAEGGVRARVWVIEATGSTTWITAEIEGGIRLTGLANGDARFHVDESVRIDIDRERVLRFDAASGRALSMQ